MNSDTLHATAVVSRNSLDYVDAVLGLNAAHQLLVGVPDAAAAAALAGIHVDEVRTPGERHGWYTAHHPLVHSADLAQVAFTSGTEGKPKGIVLSLANLADAAERITSVMGMTADIREYVGVPATYSFGMGRFRTVSAVGGSAYLPPRGFDPLEFARMLEAGEVNALSAVPTLLRILLASPEVIGDAGRRLRWMEIGSQYMSADEKRAIRQLFPDARIVQHYGLTEASRSTFLIVSDADDDQLDSVGSPVGATEVQLTADGRIRIRGPHVARWRLQDEALHALQDEDGWLTTNDLGHLRDGQLYYDGRADDLINMGGIKVPPELLEGHIRQLVGQATRLAVARVADPLRGDGVLVAAEAGGASVAELRSAASSALRALGVEAGSALHVEVMDTLPCTATGKVQRRTLSERFTPQPAAAPLPTGEPGSKDVLALFRHIFPDHVVEPEDSFESLGGDSLLYIRFSMDFERRFAALPTGWEAMTVAQLQALLPTMEKTGFWRKLDISILTRATAMTFIVALHSDAFVYSRNWGAAYFLYMLAGYSLVRFQLPEINRSGRLDTVFGTILRVALPTILVVGGFQLWAHHFELLPLLLVSNFFDPDHYQVVYYYFVEIYIQLLLLAALLFSFSGVRRRFREKPMASAIALLVLVALVDLVIRQFWDTTYIYDRSPHRYAWTFACGVLMASATDRQSRLLAMAVVTGACLLKWGLSPAMYWVDGACFLLLFLPDVKVPATIKFLVAEVAGASMFIFLSHYQAPNVVHRLLGHDSAWVSLPLALVVGIAFAHAYLWVENQVRARLPKRQSAPRAPAVSASPLP